MSGRPLSAAARKQAGSRSPLRAAAIIRWATSLRTISSWPTSQSSSQAVSKASPIAAAASGSNAPCSLKGLIGMAVYPSRLPLTPPTQIGHKQEGSSNIILAMPQFATACHIHKVGLQIHLQALGPLKYGGHSLLTYTMPCRRPDRVALVAHRVASATQRSCRGAVRVTRQNEATVAHCLCRRAPSRGENAL